MPDLLTHWAAAAVPATALRDRRLQAVLVLGTFLPDVVSKGLQRIVLAPTYFSDPSHSFVGLIPLAYGFSLFLEAGWRKAGFIAIYAGAVLHVLLDLVKSNLGGAGMRIFTPFSLAPAELGLISTENVIYLLPLDVLVLLACFLVDRRRRAVRG